MRILIVDNNRFESHWGARDLVDAFRQFSGVTLTVRRAPHRDLPTDLSRFDRVVISGSATPISERGEWITDLQNLILGLFERSVPTLGICYGHQLIVKTLGGSEMVKKLRRSEFGWAQIEVTESSRLFQNVPKQFYCFQAHYDEVTALPAGFRNLARSKDCQIQAFEMEEKPMYGIQFHPERGIQEAEQTYLQQKKKKEHAGFLNPGKGHELYNPEIAQKIFGNFVVL